MLLILEIGWISERTAMDACSATLKSTSHLANVSKSAFCSEKNGFWGERIRGSLNNCARAHQFGKRLSLEKRGRKIKPGVAYSVLTRENCNETLVSICISHFPILCFSLEFFD